MCMCGMHNALFIYLFIYDFTAAVAVDRPAISGRAGWKKEEKKI